MGRSRQRTGAGPQLPHGRYAPEVRDKFTDRLAQQLRTAQAAHPVDGPVRVEIADAGDGSVMATVAP
jgi:hypothetical protein